MIFTISIYCCDILIVSLNQSYDQLQLDDENEGPRYFMPEDEQDDVEDGHEDGHEPEEELKPSLQAIKELEDLTLKEPKNINAWLQLERRLTKSYLPKKYELGLACLAEGLNFNPTNGKLWRRYWILFNQTYPAADRNDDFRKKKTEIKEFCEENVDLGCNDFWTKYINMEKTFLSKAEVLEKYIARLLQHQITRNKSRDPDIYENMNDYQLQFASAILYRAYLLTLEGSINDAQDFILDFIKLCPTYFGTLEEEKDWYKEFSQDHDPESEIQFDSKVKFGMLLATIQLIVKNELPELFQRPRFRIWKTDDFDFKSELVTFDLKTFIFNPERNIGDFDFKLNEISMVKMNDIERIARGEDIYEEGWYGVGTKMESLVLQLFELFERTGAWCDGWKLISDNYGSYMWGSNFDLLRIHIATQRGESVDAIIESEFTLKIGDDPQTSSSTIRPELGFPLAYHMFGLDSEEGLANALTYLEATIGN